MNSLKTFLLNAEKTIEEIPGFRVTGYVEEISGVMITARLQHVKIGEICRIEADGRSLEAEVVGFRQNKCLLMPYAFMHGIRPESKVIPTGRSLCVRCGPHLLGSVLNGLGQVLSPGIEAYEANCRSEVVDVEGLPPDPLTRQRISRILPSGIPMIDAFLSIGKGQRIGIFASAGTGKSTLMGEMAQLVSADVIIINLIGERGREVRDFLEDNLKSEGLARSVVVVATSDQPAIIRLKSAYVATAIAEYFRKQGMDVCLMMDSVTRFARALREIGLARGEPPARAGYPPSVYAELPRLMERTGTSAHGTITAFYTVLVEGDDLSDPVADEVLSILDGHIILSRKLAHENHYPAIDLLQSKSRIMHRIISGEHRKMCSFVLENLALYKANEDAIRFGFYESGKNQDLDLAIRFKSFLDEYLFKESNKHRNLHELLSDLQSLKTLAEQ